MSYWGAIASVVGSLIQNNASGNAADAQAHAGQGAIDEQRREFDHLQELLGPYAQAGSGGLAGLNKLAAGDYSGFNQSPDYLYSQEQMQQGLDHSAAARGRLYSGGYGVDLAHELGGLASQNLGNYRNSLQWLAGLGENAAAGVGNSGMQMANNIGGYLTNIGNARANNALSQGDNWANALGQFASSYGAANNNSNSAFSGSNYNANNDTLAPYYTNTGNSYNGNLDNGYYDYNNGGWG